jgi:hypothetical protein
LNWLRRYGYRARTWLARVSGDRIPGPYARETLAFQHADDPKDNLGLTPAADSHLSVLGIWAFEAFTPSNVEGALERMRRNGWALEHRRGAARDLVSWLRSIRKAGAEGNHNVWFHRPDDGRYSAIGHHAKLPTFADYAVGELVALTPSISGLCLFFVLKPEARGEIEAALRRTRVSYVRTRGHGRTTIDPRAGRLLAMEAIRRGWREEIDKWFAHYAPGVFAEEGGEDRPTCELLVGDNFSLFPRDDAYFWKVSEAAGVAMSPWTFEEEADDPAMFVPSLIPFRKLGSHAILAVSRRRLESSVHQLHKVAGEDRHLLGADEQFRENFTRWALIGVVSTYTQRINRARDQAARLFSSGFPLGILKRLQRLTTVLGDTAVLARELKAYAETNMRSRRLGYELFRRRERPREARLFLQDWIERALKLESERLAVAGPELDGFIAAQGNLTNARANLQLQLIVFVFAVVGLVFAAVSAIEAAANLLGQGKS